MVKPVDRIIPDFAKAGANIITFHPEASEHIDRTLQLIRDTAAKPAWSSIRPHLEPSGTRDGQARHHPDDVGQSGLWWSILHPPHTEEDRGSPQMIDESGRDIMLEVDGGIKIDNIEAAARAGADTFVAGSAIFGKPDYKAVIDAMRSELAKV